MANEDTKLIVSLEARVDQFEKALAKASGTADKHFSSMERRAKESGNRMSEAMSRGAEGINAVLETIGIGLGLREMEEMVDNFTRLNSRIRAVAGSAEEAKAVFEEWVLTAKFHDYPDGWIKLFREAGYTGDYYWTIIE